MGHRCGRPAPGRRRAGAPASLFLPRPAGREPPLRRSEGCRVVAPLPLCLPRPGFRNPARPLSTPRRVGLRVTWARKRAPLGYGYRSSEHLGDPGGTLQWGSGCRISSGAFGGLGRVSRRPLSGSAAGRRSSSIRISARLARSGLPWSRTEAPPRLCHLSGYQWFCLNGLDRQFLKTC